MTPLERMEEPIYGPIHMLVAKAFVEKGWLTQEELDNAEQTDGIIKANGMLFALSRIIKIAPKQEPDKHWYRRYL